MTPLIWSWVILSDLILRISYFILGISGLITPLHIKQRIVCIDVPIVIAMSIGLYVLALDGILSLSDGVVLLLGLLAYSVFTYLQVRKNKVDIEELYEQDEEVQLPQEPGFMSKCWNTWLV